MVCSTLAKTYGHDYFVKRWGIKQPSYLEMILDYIHIYNDEAMLDFREGSRFYDLLRVNFQEKDRKKPYPQPNLVNFDFVEYKNTLKEYFTTIGLSVDFKTTDDVVDVDILALGVKDFITLTKL